MLVSVSTFSCNLLTFNLSDILALQNAIYLLYYLVLDLTLRYIIQYNVICIFCNQRANQLLPGIYGILRVYVDHVHVQFTTSPRGTTYDEIYIVYDSNCRGNLKNRCHLIRSYIL